MYGSAVCFFSNKALAQARRPDLDADPCQVVATRCNILQYPDGYEAIAGVVIGCQLLR